MEQMWKYRFNVPVEIRFGQGTLRESIQDLKRLGMKRPLVVTDPALVKLEWFQSWLRQLEQEQIACTVFQGVETEPDEPTVNAGVAAFRAHGCDSVIGVGGGSALDASKAINVLAYNGGDRIHDYLRPNTKLIEGRYPMVLIATTAGTGAEITRGTVVTDAHTNVKKGFGGGGCYADVAIIDPDLTASLPKRLLASSGLDAFCHALESFISNQNHPFAYMLSKEALRLIVKSLPRMYQSPADDAVRQQMAQASLLATMAFSTGGGLSYPHHLADIIGPVYKVPHGFACAMNLAATLELVLEEDMLGDEKRADLHAIFGSEEPVAFVKAFLRELDAPNLADHVPTDLKTLERISREVILYSFRADVFRAEVMLRILQKSARAMEGMRG